MEHVITVVFRINNIVARILLCIHQLSPFIINVLFVFRSMSAVSTGDEKACKPLPRKRPEWGCRLQPKYYDPNEVLDRIMRCEMFLQQHGTTKELETARTEDGRRGLWWSWLKASGYDENDLQTMNMMKDEWVITPEPLSSPSSSSSSSSSSSTTSLSSSSSPPTPTPEPISSPPSEPSPDSSSSSSSLSSSSSSSSGYSYTKSASSYSFGTVQSDKSFPFLPKKRKVDAPSNGSTELKMSDEYQEVIRVNNVSWNRTRSAAMDILGYKVSEGFSTKPLIDSDLRTRYKKMCMKVHPDKVHDTEEAKKEAGEAMTKLKECYEFLLVNKAPIAVRTQAHSQNAARVFAEFMRPRMGTTPISRDTMKHYNNFFGRRDPKQSLPFEWTDDDDD
jgi:hypothetical protein